MRSNHFSQWAFLLFPKVFILLKCDIFVCLVRKIQYNTEYDSQLMKILPMENETGIWIFHWNADLPILRTSHSESDQNKVIPCVTTCKNQIYPSIMYIQNVNEERFFNKSSHMVECPYWNRNNFCFELICAVFTQRSLFIKLLADSRWPFWWHASRTSVAFGAHYPAWNE